MDENVISCSQCEVEEEAMVPVYTYYRKADGSEAGPDELTEYWMAVSEDADLWTRIVDGNDPNYSVSITSMVEKVWVPPQFVGTPGEAVENGWSEEEYGWICPACVSKKFDALAERVTTLEKFFKIVKD